MTPAEQIATVEEFMLRIGGDDLEGALKFVHSDFEVIEPPSPPNGGAWRGRDGFIRLFPVARSAWPAWGPGTYPYELASVGGRVIKKSRITTTGHATGLQVELDFVEVMEFKEGLIATIRATYADPNRT